MTAPGHMAAMGGTPLLGNPGTVLPVTVDDAESFAGFGSTGELAVRVAMFTTGVVPVTVTTVPPAGGPVLGVIETIVGADGGVPSQSFPEPYWLSLPTVPSSSAWPSRNDWICAEVKVGFA